jgi:integrase
MPGFMSALDKRPGVSAAALRFVILTAARTGEVRRMTWREVDCERGLWTVPAERMKARKLHVVPLPGPALRVLDAMRPLARGPDSLVFPSPQRGGEISDMALTMLVRGLACDGLADGEAPRFRDAEGRVPVPHGFRSAFKDWSRAQGWADHLSELALAHVDGNATRAAYGRDALVEERRPMMAAWAAWYGGGAAILPLRRGVAGR